MRRQIKTDMSVRLIAILSSVVVSKLFAYSQRLLWFYLWCLFVIILQTTVSVEPLCRCYIRNVIHILSIRLQKYGERLKLLMIYIFRVCYNIYHLYFYVLILYFYGLYTLFCYENMSWISAFSCTNNWFK